MDNIDNTQPNDLLSLLQQFDAARPDVQSQAPLLQQLVQQHMTQGLGVDPVRGLQYSGGVAGYDGPTRPSDNAPIRPMTMAEQAPLMKVIGSLDPDLQGLALHQLGLLPAEAVGMGPMSRAKELAQFRHDLEAPQRSFANSLQEQRLQQAQDRLAELQSQFGQRQDLAQSRENRLSVGGRLPLSAVNAAMLEMSKNGATKEQMQSALEGMGYGSSGTMTKGGFLGMFGHEVPVPAMREQGGGLPKAPQQGAKLTPEMAQQFVDAAGGDKQKARLAAKAQGWNF